MKQVWLQGIPSRKRWRGRKSGERPEDVTNHLGRDFGAETPNTKWVTDITYIRTAEGWLYLAVVLDLFSRQVIGWWMQSQLSRELVILAVLMAIWQRSTPDSAYEFQAFLKAHGIVSI